MRLSVLFVELLHVAASLTEGRLRRARRLRCGAALAALIDAARGVPWTRYHHQTCATFVTQSSLGTRRARAARSGVPGVCALKSGAHGVSPQNTETVKFNQKQNDGIFEHEDLSALTVIRGEDAVQWTVLLPAQESLLAGDAQQLRLDPRSAIRETTKMCFQVPLQRRCGATQPTSCPSAKSAPGSLRKKTQQPWRRGVSRTGPIVRKNLVWIRHGPAMPACAPVSVCLRQV